MPTGVYPRKRAENANHWKDGTTLSNGYLYIYKPEHPRATLGNMNYVMHGVLVLEEKLGRPLREGYEPHHINGIKTDDRPENLEETEHIKHLNYSSWSYQKTKTHCPQGHPYNLLNTYFNKFGHRSCRQCRLERRATTNGNISNQ